MIEEWQLEVCWTLGKGHNKLHVQRFESSLGDARRRWRREEIWKILALMVVLEKSAHRIKCMHTQGLINTYDRG